MDPVLPMLHGVCWGCGENLTETAIADKGLKGDAFLSARLGGVSQAERTGVESPYDGVWGDGQCGRCGGRSRERRRGGLRGKGRGQTGWGRKATETLGFSSEQNGSPWRVQAGQIMQAIPGISPSLPPPPSPGWAFISLPPWAASPVRNEALSHLP